MRKKFDVDFLKYRKFTIICSIIIFLFSLYSLNKFKLNFGLDFTGGIIVHLKFHEPIAIKDVKEKLIKNQFNNIQVKYYNSTNDVLIQLSNIDKFNLNMIKNKIIHSFQKNVTIKRIEFIGAEVGSELIEKSIIATIISIICTIMYISLRFEYKLAISSAIGLFHVTFFILGVISFFQIKFDLTTLASLLAVIGYSLNDTIVVFDRIRENLYKIKNGNIYDIINISINQTLSRTILTSFFTMLVVLSLLFGGGESLHSFSLVFFIGIIVGTYSSIYVSTNFAMYLGLKKY